MSYDVNATFSSEQTKLDNTFPVMMVCLNASNSGWTPLYYVNVNQDLMGYELNATGDVTGTEVLYTGLPLNFGSFQSDIKSETPGFDVSIPNTDRVIESIVQSNNYLRGNEAYIILMYADHLPSGVTADYVGNNPDRYAYIKEKFYVDSCTSNQQVISFSLKNKLTIKNITVPRRLYSRECHWALVDRYTATECDPTSSVDTGTYPTCDGSLESCRLRENSARYGGFPSVPRSGIVIV